MCGYFAVLDVGASESVCYRLECPFPLLQLTRDDCERDFITTYDEGARDMMNVPMRKVSGMAVNLYDAMICGVSVSTFLKLALYFDIIINPHHDYPNVRDTIK
jgi:hypothetical protein